MINGRLGKVLLLGMLSFVPLELLTVSNLGPGDLFSVLLMVTTWVVLWRERRPMRWPLTLGMWLILVGSLLGTLSGLDWLGAGISLVQEVYLFLMFITIVNAITDRKSLEWMVKVWAIVAAVEAVIIMLDLAGFVLPVIGGGNVKAQVLGISADVAAATEIGRAVGTFRNANAAGGYMMISSFVLLAVPFSRNRLVRWGLPLLYSVAIVATGSIGAQMGQLLGIVVASFYWMRQRGRASTFWIGLAALGLAVGGFMTPFVMPLLGGSQGSLLFSLGSINRKLDKRLVLWERVDWLMADNPLGIGPNATATVATIGAHSDYVGFFSERGQIGFIGLFLMYGEIVLALGLLDRYGRGWAAKLAPGPLLGGLLALMIMGVVHETFHGRPVWMMFAVTFVLYGFSRRSLSLAPAGTAPVVEVAAPRVGPVGLLADQAK